MPEPKDSLQWDTPPAAFAFSVSIGSSQGGPDAGFQEVSGLSAELETEAVAEGGENRFVHQLPKAMKYPRLTLQRGVAPASSALVAWCKEVLEGALAKPIEPRHVLVSLLDAAGEPLCSWSFVSAYPVRWELQPLGSTRNEVALEKIELAYAYCERKK